MQEQSSYVEGTLELYSEAVDDFQFVPACGRKRFGDGNGLAAV